MLRRPAHEVCHFFAFFPQAPIPCEWSRGQRAVANISTVPAAVPASSALRRHAPKVGAQCGNSARWDLRRGAARKGGPYRDYFIRTHTYARTGILTHALPTSLPWLG
jgi:hypothetical protein